MSIRRISTIALRVVRQVIRDRRTVALLIVGPILVLTLGAILFRVKPEKIPLGIVNVDQGIHSPLIGTINLGAQIIDELSSNESLEIIQVEENEINEKMSDGTVQAVVIFPEDFTTSFLESKQMNLDLRLEGSNPTRSLSITAQVAQAATKALASLAGSSFESGSKNSSNLVAPVTVKTSYLFGGEEFDTMDYIAPVYIAVLAMFFVFLLACVSFVRERSQGTLERLAATPATRSEIVIGYMCGLGIFALIQVAVILFYTVWVLNIHYRGSLAILFLVIALLALMGVNMGILASAFARNEFQVIQFIPLIILPQVLLSGTIWPVSDLPGYLKPLAYAMPLYYANTAMRDVMLKGWGFSEIWWYLAILVAIIGLFALLSVKMMRREMS